MRRGDKSTENSSHFKKIIKSLDFEKQPKEKNHLNKSIQKNLVKIVVRK